MNRFGRRSLGALKSAVRMWTTIFVAAVDYGQSGRGNRHVSQLRRADEGRPTDRLDSAARTSPRTGNRGGDVCQRGLIPQRPLSRAGDVGLADAVAGALARQIGREMARASAKRSPRRWGRNLRRPDCREQALNSMSKYARHDGQCKGFAAVSTHALRICKRIHKSTHKGSPHWYRLERRGIESSM
jgi:hypothetical protein